MPYRNQPTRIPVILVVTLAIAAFVVPAQAAPVSPDTSPASAWSLIDGVWQSLIGAVTGNGGVNDGESGPIMDPDGQQLTAPQDDLGVTPEAPGGSPSSSDEGE